MKLVRFCKNVVFKAPKSIPDIKTEHNGIKIKEITSDDILKYVYLKKRIEYVREHYNNLEIFIDTLYDNIPARKTHKALKMIEAGMYCYISVGTLRIPYCYIALGKYFRNRIHLPIPQKKEI